jgi:hypothetical protein
MTPLENRYSDYLERRAAANTRLASCGVKCLNSSVVLLLGISGGLTVKSSENPHERQAWERYASCYGDSANINGQRKTARQ